MKKLFLWSILIASVFAIEIKIYPDKNITVSQKDADALKHYFQKLLHFTITDKGAYDIAKENRVLANEYLKEYGLKDFDKRYLTIQAEQYLSDTFVELFQKKTKIDEKTALSYYLDHKDEFKKEDQVDGVLFSFDSFDKALQFYQKGQNKDFATLKKLAKENNATIRDFGYHPITQIKNPTRAYIQKYKRSHLLLPPVIIAMNRVTVFYVKDYKKEKGYEDFDKVKRKIINILYKKAFVKMRNQLLKKYGVSDE